MLTAWLQLVALRISTGSSFFCFLIMFLYLLKYKQFLTNVFFMFSAFETELRGVIPVVKASIGGTRIIGRLCAGS